MTNTDESTLELLRQTSHYMPSDSADEDITRQAIKNTIPKIRRQVPIFRNGDVVLTHLLKPVNADTIADVSFEGIEKEIRQLAYRKWEEDGSPVGNDSSLYWVSAQQELFGLDPLTDGGYHIFIRNDGGNWVECIVRP